jgi:hypothetical protein
MLPPQKNKICFSSSLNSVLNNNPELLKFKKEVLLENIKTSYIDVLRNSTDHINNDSELKDDKFLYFIRKDRDYITDELNEIVYRYYFYFIEKYLLSFKHYTTVLDSILAEINAGNNNIFLYLENFLSYALKNYIENYIVYSDSSGSITGDSICAFDKCFTSVDIRYYKSKEFKNSNIGGTNYISDSLKSFLENLYSLSKTFSLTFILTNSAKNILIDCIKERNKIEVGFEKNLKEELKLFLIPSYVLSYDNNNENFEKWEKENVNDTALNILIEKYLLTI